MRNMVMVGYTSTEINASHCHFHDAWELVYFVSGSGFFHYGDNFSPFEPGTIVIVPPLTPHYQDIISGYISYFIMFEHSSDNQRAVRVYQDQNGYIKPLLESLYAHFYSFQPNRSNICEATLSLIAQYLVSYDITLDEQRGNRAVLAFLNALASQFNSPSFDLKTAIDNVPYSGDYYRKLFKKETGQSPTQYLNSLRIDFARRLLEESSMSVKGISTMSGFNDPYYFSRQFKANYGKSPKEWRAMVRENQETVNKQTAEEYNGVGRNYNYSNFTIWT